VSVPVPGTAFRMTGEPTAYVKTTAESGNPRVQAFCPRCGSPIYSTSPGEGVQPSYMVRVGILRQRREFLPKKQNWFRSSLPWLGGRGAVPRDEKQGWRSAGEGRPPRAARAAGGQASPAAPRRRCDRIGLPNVAAA